MFLTFDDFEKADDKESFILSAIANHKGSDEYKLALIADEYDAQKNTTITGVVRTIYNAQGIEVNDYTVSNSKIASNFFNRLNTQRCMYSLGNGITFVDPYEAATGDIEDTSKKALGPHFDHVLKEAGYHALIHGVSYMFWNMDRAYEFKMTEFVPLVDESTGVMRAGIRFWQLAETKPLNVVLYEEDGYTRYKTGKRDEDGGTGGLEVVEPKRAYKVKYEYTDAGDILHTDEENYSSLPVVRVYASRLKQSTLVGMRQSIDAYDMISSGFANDIIDCAQVYWIVENYGGMDEADLAEFLDKLKYNHIANIDTSSGGAVTPYKQDIPTHGRSTFLMEIRQRIFEDFGALDVHEIAEGATNDHVDAAYQPMDENAADFEHWIGDAVSQLLKLQGIDDEPIFHRARISNQLQQTEMVLAEAPYLDRATILRKLPNLTPEEVEAILENTEEEMLAQQAMLAQTAEEQMLKGNTQKKEQPEEEEQEPNDGM